MLVIFVLIFALQVVVMFAEDIHMKQMFSSVSFVCAFIFEKAFMIVQFNAFKHRRNH